MRARLLFLAMATASCVKLGEPIVLKPPGGASRPTPTPPPARLGTPEGDRWRKAASEHFTVVGNGRDDQVRALLLELERFRRIVQASMPEVAEIADPPIPVTVYALQAADDLTVLLPELGGAGQAKLSGVCQTNQFGADLLIGLDMLEDSVEETPRAVVRHEYHHLFFDRVAPRSPLWLREGLAEMWADAPSGTTTLRLGFVPNDRRLRSLRTEPLIPLGTLVSVDEKSPEYRSEDRAGVFYSEARMLANYILHGGGGGNEALLAYARAGAKSGTPEEAFARGFGPIATIDSGFQAFLSAGDYAATEIALPADLPTVMTTSFEPLSEARVYALRARPIAWSARSIEALPLVRKALGLDPQDSLALEMAGVITVVMARDWDSAHPYFRDAADQPDASFAAHFLAARSAPTGEGTKFLDPSYVEKHLARSLELAPRFPAALAFRGVLAAKKDPPEAVRLTALAAQLAPGEPVYELRHGRMLVRTGKRPEGLAHIKSAVERALSIRERSSEASAALCLEGSLGGFAKEVFSVCDDAVALDPNGKAARQARAVSRSLRGQPKLAAQDVRWLVKNDYPINVQYDVVWLDALERGAQPRSDTYRNLADPTWGL